MAVLGEYIDTDELVAGARDFTLVRCVSPEEHAMDTTVLRKMGEMLRRLADKTFDAKNSVCIFGSYFLGRGDVMRENDYTEPLRDVMAGVHGIYRGMRTVYLDEPVRVADDIDTHVVPALQVDVVPVDIKDIHLGAAQLFSSVAVPLIGQSAAAFECIGTWRDRR